MSRKGYRYDAIRAAKDLLYGDRVIELIKSAKSDDEIYRIMCTARSSERNIPVRKKAVHKKRCLDRHGFCWC